MGIKCAPPGEVWRWLNELGDEQSHFVLEQLCPVMFYHVDLIVWGGEVLFAVAQKYGGLHQCRGMTAGVYLTVLDRGFGRIHALLQHNQEVTAALRVTINGVMHTEFIRSRRWCLLFLETAARVGAGVDKLPEGAAGVNLWREWARLEVALAKGEQCFAATQR